MDKTTKKFNKTVAALTKELAAPTPRTRKVNKILSTLRKHLTAGVDPEDMQYFALRTAWVDNYESLPANTAEELRDIAFTYSKGLRAVTYRNLVTESLSNSPDPDILDCNYDLLIDLTCECYETEGNEDCTPWGNTLTPEEIEVFLSLPAPEGGTAEDDREVLVKRCLGWNRRGAVSRKFEIWE